MSLVRPVLNTWLRLTEKPHLAQADEQSDLRRSFEWKSRLFFRAPWGSRFERGQIASVPVLHVAARGVAQRASPRLLYFHGGGYVFGSANTHRAMVARISAHCGMPAVVPDYRLAPEHPFPAAFEDALEVYDAMLSEGDEVILGGDSAGGGLALALLAAILDRGLPKPRATFAFSPLTDLTFSGQSIAENAAADVVLPASRLADAAQMYLQGKAADDPHASPLFADFGGAPPVWLAVGTTEILRDDTFRLAEKLRASGAAIHVEIGEDLPHVWPFFQSLLPEAHRTIARLAGWLTRAGGRSAGS